MESATAISELNWSIDGSMFSAAATQQDHHFAGLISAEEAHIMAQLFSASSYSDQEAMNTVSDRDSYYYCSDNSHSNLFNHVLDFEAFPWNDIMKNGVPKMSSSLSNISDNRNHCLEFHGLNNHNVDESVYPNKAISSDKSGEVHTTNQSETIISKHALQSKRKMQENSDLEITPIKRTEQQNCTTPNLEVERGDYPSDSPQKKSRLSGDGERAGKEIHLKKNQKHFRTNEGEENMGLNGQSSSSYGSEDDSLSSQEQNGTTSCGKGSAAPALNLNGKARAGRGSATDPQSLYARKRREKINERLRILQTLVPNGTKVDISTMLEEAVQYVKFLQMQIKLLSSDDLWMYAPIAYNGMDIGLDFKISPPS